MREEWRDGGIASHFHILDATRHHHNSSAAAWVIDGIWFGTGDIGWRLEIEKRLGRKPTALWYVRGAETLKAPFGVSGHDRKREVAAPLRSGAENVQVRQGDGRGMA